MTKFWKNCKNKQKKTFLNAFTYVLICLMTKIEKNDKKLKNSKNVKKYKNTEKMHF